MTKFAYPIVWVLLSLPMLKIAAEVHPQPWNYLYTDREGGLFSSAPYCKYLPFENQIYQANFESVKEFVRELNEEIRTGSIQNPVTILAKNIAIESGHLTLKAEHTRGSQEWKYRRELTALFEWCKGRGCVPPLPGIDPSKKYLMVSELSRFLLENKVAFSQKEADTRSAEIISHLETDRPYLISRSANYCYYVYFVDSIANKESLKITYDGIKTNDSVSIAEFLYLFGWVNGEDLSMEGIAAAGGTPLFSGFGSIEQQFTENPVSLLQTIDITQSVFITPKATIFPSEPVDIDRALKLVFNYNSGLAEKIKTLADHELVETKSESYWAGRDDPKFGQYYRMFWLLSNMDFNNLCLQRAPQTKQGFFDMKEAIAGLKLAHPILQALKSIALNSAPGALQESTHRSVFQRMSLRAGLLAEKYIDETLRFESVIPELTSIDILSAELEHKIPAPPPMPPLFIKGTEPEPLPGSPGDLTLLNQEALAFKLLSIRKIEHDGEIGGNYITELRKLVEKGSSLRKRAPSACFKRRLEFFTAEEILNLPEAEYSKLEIPNVTLLGWEQLIALGNKTDLIGKLPRNIHLTLDLLLRRMNKSTKEDWNAEVDSRRQENTSFEKESQRLTIPKDRAPL